MRFVVLGLSLSSSWGNGHATTYRSLLRALAARGHEIVFLERDLPFYAANRDLPAPGFARLELYADTADLQRRFAGEIRAAEFIIIGSYVPDGIAIGQWLLAAAKCPVAFYDIDTPITLENVATHGTAEYIDRDLIARYPLYLSFTGGPTLQRLEQEFGSPRARALYCSVDPALYYRLEVPERWDLGYLGTYSLDRQPPLETLLLETARRAPELAMVVAGPQYPENIHWPANVERIDHLPPAEHTLFYNQQSYTLNITRRAMLDAGHSPSVRVFEAAACGVPIITDRWPGLTNFFVPDEEILVAETTADTLRFLRGIDPRERREIGARGRVRVLAAHTADHRAAELEAYAQFRL